MADVKQVWPCKIAEVFRLQATAWNAIAKEESDRALELMRVAVELENQTEKSGLSSDRGPPAHEQQHHMLTELGRPQEAWAEYEASMSQAPRRFNTYLGPARAANGVGKPELARVYYAK